MSHGSHSDYEDTLPDSVHAKRVFPKPVDPSGAIDDAYSRGFAEGRRVEREAQEKSDIKTALAIAMIGVFGVYLTPIVLVLRMYGKIGLH